MTYIRLETGSKPKSGFGVKGIQWPYGRLKSQALGRRTVCKEDVGGGGEVRNHMVRGFNLSEIMNPCMGLQK